jgi:hypothetical protein
MLLLHGIICVALLVSVFYHIGSYENTATQYIKTNLKIKLPLFIYLLTIIYVCFYFVSAFIRSCLVKTKKPLDQSLFSFNRSPMGRPYRFYNKPFDFLTKRTLTFLL